MLYSDAFRKMVKSPLTLTCLVIVGVCAVLASFSAIDAVVLKMGGKDTIFFERPTDDHKDDPITGLNRSYHPPTPFLALGWEVGLDTKALERMKAEAPENYQRVTARLNELQRDGLFSANAWHLPLGADRSGRNVLHMVLHGLRWAFVIGIVTTAISVFVGVCLGSLAGYFGGFIDDIIVWFYTTLASIPFLLLLIAILGMVPNDQRQELGLMVMLVVIGLVVWVGLARLIRAEFMKHKQRDYVQACRALGYGHMRIIFKHILPNVIHVAIITFTLSFVSSINIEVFLTFVGVGAQSTDPTWGRIISDAKSELSRDPSVWWPLTSATAFLFVLSLAFSIFGDALRDALDPKLRTGS